MTAEQQKNYFASERETLTAEMQRQKALRVQASGKAKPDGWAAREWAAAKKKHVDAELEHEAAIEAVNHLEIKLQAARAAANKTRGRLSVAFRQAREMGIIQ